MINLQAHDNDFMFQNSTKHGSSSIVAWCDSSWQLLSRVSRSHLLHHQLWEHLHQVHHLHLLPLLTVLSCPRMLLRRLLSLIWNYQRVTSLRKDTRRRKTNFWLLFWERINPPLQHQFLMATTNPRKMLLGMEILNSLDQSNNHQQHLHLSQHQQLQYQHPQLPQQSHPWQHQEQRQDCQIHQVSGKYLTVDIEKYLRDLQIGSNLIH